jgi:uncharacterized protein
LSNPRHQESRVPHLRVVAVALSLASLNAAHAGGINCAKAKSRVERLICGSKELVAADAALSDVYRETVDAAADGDKVVQSQRAWLKQRDACADAKCLAETYQSRTDALKQVPRAEWATYSDPALGISFEYLANRKVVKPCPVRGGEGCVALVGRDMKKGEYLIAFELKDGELESVASEEAGFERQEDGTWMTTYGRGDPQKVERFAGTGWKGMRATISCGVDGGGTGFHAVAGDCFWAVMGNGKRAVVVDTQGLVGTDRATMRSVTSFQFLR